MLAQDDAAAVRSTALLMDLKDGMLILLVFGYKRRCVLRGGIRAAVVLLRTGIFDRPVVRRRQFLIQYGI